MGDVKTAETPRGYYNGYNYRWTIWRGRELECNVGANTKVLDALCQLKGSKSPCCWYAVRSAAAGRNMRIAGGPGYFWGSSAAMRP
jgi:hypothetical protein